MGLDKEEVPVKAVALAMLLLLSGITLLSASVMHWLGLIDIQEGAVSASGLAVTPSNLFQLYSHANDWDTHVWIFCCCRKWASLHWGCLHSHQVQAALFPDMQLSFTSAMA